MNWRSMVDKDYMGAWDLADRDGNPKDFTLTIDSVKSESVKTAETPKGKRKVVIRFKGAQKAFIGNSTNCTVIESMYGPDVRQWVGKPVTLYQTQVRSPKGGQVPGIRVRPRVPTGKPETLEGRPVDEGMRAEQNAAFREPGEEG